MPQAIPISTVLLEPSSGPASSVPIGPCHYRFAEQAAAAPCVFHIIGTPNTAQRVVGTHHTRHFPYLHDQSHDPSLPAHKEP